MPGIAAKSAERVQGLVEGLDAKHCGLALVQYSQPRVGPGRERILLGQPEAEAVDRRDPGAVEIAGQLGSVELAEPSPEAGTQVGCRPLGVGDHEDRADVDARLDCACEALDQNGRLAGARAGRDEDEPGRLDRRMLLRGRRPLHGGTHGMTSSTLRVFGAATDMAGAAPNRFLGARGFGAGGSRGKPAVAPAGARGRATIMPASPGTSAPARTTMDTSPPA